MLDVRRLRVLREVAVRGSFSAAAESLSFTQSAISQQIAALEREAGAVLVQRSARGVRLTEAGEALVRHTDAIMARLAEAEAELEAIAGLRGGRLRMAAFESAGSTLMPLAIAAFRERHPAVELSLSLSEPEDCVPLAVHSRRTRVPSPRATAPTSGASSGGRRTIRSWRRSSGSSTRGTCPVARTWGCTRR